MQPSTATSNVSRNSSWRSPVAVYWGGASVPGTGDSSGSSVGATAGSSAGATAGSSVGAVSASSVPAGAQAPTASVIPSNKGRTRNFNFIEKSPDYFVIRPYNQSVRKSDPSLCPVGNNSISEKPPPIGRLAKSWSYLGTNFQ
jgi:hypothetical protein